MKYELKPCPFCGGEFDLKEEWNREYMQEQYDEGKGYAIGATCKGCGVQVHIFDTDLNDPLNADEAIEKLAERVNHRISYEKHPTIYIAGAITQDPDYKEKFAAAAAFFRAKGYDVINPAETVLDEYAGYKDYIDHGLAQVMTADVVCMLNIRYAYIPSDGAALECKYADTVGIPIIQAFYDHEKKEVTIG